MWDLVGNPGDRFSYSEAQLVQLDFVLEDMKLNGIIREENSSRKHLRTKVTPDMHLTYSKKRGNHGLI